jgi:hypothetical protein
MLGVEGLVLAHDRIEPGGHRRSGLGDALPTLARLRGVDGFLRGLTASAGQRHHIVIGRPAHRIAGGIGIIRRSFAARALAQHASQAQEDEHRQRQKDDGIDIEHVSHALDRREGTAGSVESKTGNLQTQRRFPHHYVSAPPH